MSAAIASKGSNFGSSVEDTNGSVRHFEFTGANKIWFAEQITLVDQARRRPLQDASRLSHKETQALVIIDALQKIQKQQGFVDDAAVLYLAQKIGCDVSSVDIVMRQFNGGPFNNNFYTLTLFQALRSRFSMLLYPKFNSLSEWMKFNFKLLFSGIVSFLFIFLVIILIKGFFIFFNIKYFSDINVGLAVFILFYYRFSAFSAFFRGILGLVFPPRYLLRAALSRKLMR